MKARSAVALALAFALVACSAPRPASAPEPSPRLAADLATKAVALVDDADAYCSGVWVGGEEILTAAHCLRGSGKGDLLEYAGAGDVSENRDAGTENVTARTAIVAAVDEGHDLALLHALFVPVHGVAELATGPLVVGEPVHTMSAPEGLKFSYSSGEIAAFRFLPEWEPKGIKYVQTTAPVSPGSSGCGLFDGSGRLVGILRGAVTRGELLNLFVHRDHVRDFLAAR